MEWLSTIPIISEDDEGNKETGVGGDALHGEKDKVEVLLVCFHYYPIKVGWKILKVGVRFYDRIPYKILCVFICWLRTHLQLWGRLWGRRLGSKRKVCSGFFKCLFWTHEIVSSWAGLREALQGVLQKTHHENYARKPTIPVCRSHILGWCIENSHSPSILAKQEHPLMIWLIQSYVL